MDDEPFRVWNRFKRPVLLRAKREGQGWFAQQNRRAKRPRLVLKRFPPDLLALLFQFYV
jgi:hypothetical protein